VLARLLIAKPVALSAVTDERPNDVTRPCAVTNVDDTCCQA